MYGDEYIKFNEARHSQMMKGAFETTLLALSASDVAHKLQVEGRTDASRNRYNNLPVLNIKRTPLALDIPIPRPTMTKDEDDISLPACDDRNSSHPSI